ncbi:MAG TPA: hypothetical protein VK172_10300 [Lentimicrobium sp.]|nr:hypothetical protein [Lentimicrobium sp.]
MKTLAVLSAGFIIFGFYLIFLHNITQVDLIKIMAFLFLGVGALFAGIVIGDYVRNR